MIHRGTVTRRMSKHAHSETHRFHRGVYRGGGGLIVLFKEGNQEGPDQCMICRSVGKGDARGYR